MLPRIELDDLTLRPLASTDAAAIARHANDRELWRNMRDALPHPYSEGDGRFFIEHVAHTNSLTDNFGVEYEGEVVGCIGLIRQVDVYRRRAELGYWLGRRVWGRGLATRAVSAMANYATGCYDLVRLEARVFAWNQASMRVLEKAGFTREAVLQRAVFKDGSLTDEIIYARLF
jgi:RimJ/RimL family protein N-acetyltransferase